jgi:hypothetical protein
MAQARISVLSNPNVTAYSSSPSASLVRHSLAWHPGNPLWLLPGERPDCRFGQLAELNPDPIFPPSPIGPDRHIFRTHHCGHFRIDRLKGNHLRFARKLLEALDKRRIGVVECDDELMGTVSADGLSRAALETSRASFTGSLASEAKALINRAARSSEGVRRTISPIVVKESRAHDLESLSWWHWRHGSLGRITAQPPGA